MTINQSEIKTIKSFPYKIKDNNVLVMYVKIIIKDNNTKNLKR